MDYSEVEESISKTDTTFIETYAMCSVYDALVDFYD